MFRVGFPKPQIEVIFLELEESGMEYDTFSACYTFPKHKNTYSEFFAFSSRIGCLRLTCDLDFCSKVLTPQIFDFELTWIKAVTQG